MKFLKNIGAIALAVVIFAAIILIFNLLFFGTAWIAEKVLPVFNMAMAIALVVLVAATPFLFFKRTRIWPTMGWLYWSYGLGLTTWLYALVLVIGTWGTLAAIIGLLFLGVGIFPIALLATAFSGQWSHFWMLILSLAMLFGIRYFALCMLQKHIAWDNAMHEAIEIEAESSEPN